MKNIGGSILLSSCPEILQPIKFNGGELAVVPNEERDTHVLMFRPISGEEMEIASHPNGYSCYALAKRVASGDEIKIKEQSEYIIRCGGESIAENVFFHP